MANKAWFQQRLRDPFLQRAHRENYRSRAAYKLLEIQEKHRILAAGNRVLDLGCAPGSWTQVVAKIVGAKGVVIGIDLLDTEPVEGATLVRGDFTDMRIRTDLLARFGGKKCDAVLSDMAPNTTGIHHADTERSRELVDLALSTAIEMLKPGGHFVAKVFEGPEYRELLMRAKKAFEFAKSFAPEASLKHSREIFLVAKGFRGPA